MSALAPTPSAAPPPPSTSTPSPTPLPLTGPTLALRSLLSDLSKLSAHPFLLSIPPPSPAPSASILSPLPSSAKHLSGPHAALLARAAEELAQECENATDRLAGLGERVERLGAWVGEVERELGVGA